MSLASCKEIQRSITGSSPSPRQRFAVTLQGEDVYLFGGSRHINEEVSQYYDDLYRLHVGPEELFWEKVTQGEDIPQGRDDHCLCAVGNRLLLYGGKNNSDATDCLAGLYIFHLGLKAWEAVFTPSTAPRTLGHTMDKVGNNIYMFGGMVGGDIVIDMHLINLDDMTWDVVETKGECPAPRYNHSSAVVQDRYIYYFGGTGGEHVLYNDVFIFDTEFCSWTCPDIKYDPPNPRSLHSFANHRDKDIYVFGGQVDNGQSDVILSDELYKLSLQDRLKWKKPVVARRKLPARSSHVSFVIHSHLYIFGGVVKEGDPFEINTLKLINPSERDIVVDNDNTHETAESKQLNRSGTASSSMLSTHSQKETQPKDKDDSQGSLSDKSVENQRDLQNKSIESQQNRSLENHQVCQEVIEKDFSVKDQLGGSDARTSTPISSSSRTNSHGSYIDPENSNKKEIKLTSIPNEGDSTLTYSSTSSEHFLHDVVSTTSADTSQDLSHLHKTTSEMIEDVFKQVKYEKKQLEREKNKLSQEKKKLEKEQEKQEKKMKTFETEMVKMLEDHEKVVQEMAQKRHLEDKKDRKQLNKIQKNIEELKQKMSSH